ncbi:MAG: hypothetical protein EBZ45_05900, partial [Actinobacteria bacterium]|nr:hypothetical protein [Actinomycetota bacterium]
MQSTTTATLTKSACAQGAKPIGASASRGPWTKDLSNRSTDRLDSVSASTTQRSRWSTTEIRAASSRSASPSSRMVVWWATPSRRIASKSNIR